MRKNLSKIIIRILVIAVSIYCLLPLVITLFSSFMSQQELMKAFHLFPMQFTMRQYESIMLRNPEYLSWYWNSIRITSLTIIINIPLSLMAGYGFAKFEFPFKNLIFFIYIIVMLMPFQATLVPQYLTIKALNLMNTQYSVIFPNAVGAFGTFLITQYIKGINNEILEAAKIEGLSDFSIFFHIIIPLCRPVIAALFILLFIDSWSVVEQPIIFITDASKMPLSLQLSNVSLLQGSLLYAGGVIFMFLPLLLYLFGYDDLVEGISLSSIK